MAGFVNPYYIDRRPNTSQDFGWQSNFQMPNQPGGQVPQFNGQSPSFGQKAQQWWGDNKQTMTTDKSGVGGIGAAITSALPSESGQFSVDKNAGFKGSFQGLSQGGVVGAIAGGVMSQIGEMKRVNENLDNLQTGIDGVTYDANGRAIYNSDAVVQGMNNLSEIQKGEKSVKLGKGMDPATWAFAGIMGTRRRLRNRRRQLEKSISNAQKEFNTADASTRLRMNQMEDYSQRMDPQARLYNLYKTQFGQ